MHVGAGSNKYKAQLVSPKLGSQTFDFSYSGNVINIPALLRQYDSSLIILPALGQKKALEVNLNLQGVNLTDINDAITSQTSNQVSLIYDEISDSLRLSFSTTLDVGKDAVSESLKWQNGVAPKPVLQSDGVVRFPYGEYQPVVTCQPLNLCDIELQAGEDIQGIVIGDSARWNEGDQGIPIVYSGSGNNLIPHLVLKPNQSGLDTSLLVTTSKRTYSFKLKSASSGYVVRVGFYYPAEMVRIFDAKKAQLREERMASGTVTNPDMKMSLFDLSRANYKYSIEGKDYAWKPTQVFDDGRSVYIQLPPGVDSRSLPGICVLVDGGDDSSCEMVNFRYNNHFFIVDKLFNQAKLINGYGDSMETITIQRNPKPGFWARLFGSQ